jgi:hypothetical protein
MKISQNDLLTCKVLYCITPLLREVTINYTKIVRN